MGLRPHLLLLLIVSSAVLTSCGKIEHIVILMQENRSFDHIMGFLKQNDSRIDGCLPNGGIACANPADPADPNSEWYYVNDQAAFRQISDPSHSQPSTTQQVYGYGPTNVSVPPMTGFVKNYPHGPIIMECFPPENVPAMAQLATEFALFDRWYASVPGPTEVNRMYAYSATSDGSATNDNARLARGYPQRPIFESIDDSKYNNTWSVYFEVFPTAFFVNYTRHDKNAQKFHQMHKFYQDAAAGNLTNYVWLEPNYFDAPEHPADDQHPDHDVSLGDNLMAKVYEALRNGPLWEKTLFIITYDEHGGFFDHVPPPTGVPNPDGKNAYDVNPPFDFTRLGVRVPTLMISPWIPAGTLVSEPINSTHYEHSSIPGTIRKFFAPDQPTLTKRDAWAATFEHIVDMLDTPRTDCPTTLPRGPSHRDYRNNGLLPFDQIGSRKITDFQHSLVMACAGLNEDTWQATKGKPLEEMNEAEARTFCLHEVGRKLGWHE